MRKITLLLSAFFAANVHAQKLIGFSDVNASTQTTWEKQFDARLSSQNLDT